MADSADKGFPLNFKKRFDAIAGLVSGSFACPGFGKMGKLRAYEKKMDLGLE